MRFVNTYKRVVMQPLQRISKRKREGKREEEKEKSEEIIHQNYQQWLDDITLFVFFHFFNIYTFLLYIFTNIFNIF